MTKYIGLTIGPIYKTLLRAKKTRELWGASYLFSYLMKNIIGKIIEKYHATFIIPYVKDPGIFDSGNEVGLFHDRFIFQAADGIFDDLDRDIIGPLLYETAGEIAKKLEKTVTTDDVSKYLKAYLNIYYCEIDSDRSASEVNKEINDYLDSLELRAKFISQDGSDYLMRFLDCVNSSFLIEDAFNKKGHNFYSIPEIASREISEDLIASKQIILTPSKANPEDTDDAYIYRQIKKLKEKEFKTYHKYIAIVQADGDDLGKTIAGLDSAKTDAFEKFSKALFEFAMDAHKIITNKERGGGATIYAGGDDLLFFAPVVYKGFSVFDVCHQLGDRFREKMIEALGKDEDIPTLSFGISISYYKFPMYEALEEAQNLLFNKAKQFCGKHAVAFRCLKHSGTYYGATLSRNSEIYPHFRKLTGYDLDTKILTSVIHSVLTYKSLLLEIGLDQGRLNSFFENQFNEDIHKGPIVKEFFESVSAFIHEVCCTCKYTPDEKIDLIYSVLRLKKHLKGEKDK